MIGWNVSHHTPQVVQEWKPRPLVNLWRTLRPWTELVVLFFRKDAHNSARPSTAPCWFSCPASHWRLNKDFGVAANCDADRRFYSEKEWWCLFHWKTTECERVERRDWTSVPSPAVNHSPLLSLALPVQMLFCPVAFGAQPARKL